MADDFEYLTSTDGRSFRIKRKAAAKPATPSEVPRTKNPPRSRKISPPTSLPRSPKRRKASGGAGVTGWARRKADGSYVRRRTAAALPRPSWSGNASQPPSVTITVTVTSPVRYQPSPVTQPSPSPAPTPTPRFGGMVSDRTADLLEELGNWAAERLHREPGFKPRERSSPDPVSRPPPDPYAYIEEVFPIDAEDVTDAAIAEEVEIAGEVV